MSERRVSLEPKHIIVLDHASQGLCSKRIAREMAVHPSTVRQYRRTAMRFLGCKTLLQAVAKAIRAGLI